MRKAALRASFAPLALLAPFALVLGTATSASAQASARVLGKVRDARDQAVANATVVLWHRPVAGVTPIGPAHELRVQSDAQGRFSAELARGFAYCAQATWKADDGSARASALLEDVVGRMRVRLVEARAPEPMRLRVEGLEDAKSVGERVTLRVSTASSSARVLHESEHAKAELARGAEIPAVATRADGRVRVELHDEHGCLYVGDASGALTLRATELEVLGLRLRDASGAPVAGARVLAQIAVDGGWQAFAERRVAVSDAAGVARARIVELRKRGRGGLANLRIEREGFADGQVQVFRQHFTIQGIAKSDPRDEEGNVGVVLRAASPLRVRARAGDRALAGVAVELRWGAWRSSRGGGKLSMPMPPLVAKLDERGEFVWRGLPARAHDVELRAFLSPEQSAALADVTELPESALTILPPTDRRRGEPEALDFDAAARPRLELRVRADGEAVEGARLLFAAASRAIRTTAMSDVRGALWAFVPAGTTHVAAWHPTRGYKILPWQGRRSQEDAAAPLEVPLEAYATRELRVTRPEERRLGGLSFLRSSTQSSNPRAGYDAALCEIVVAQIEALRTDEEGRCTLRYPREPRIAFDLACLEPASGETLGFGIGVPLDGKTEAIRVTLDK